VCFVLTKIVNILLLVTLQRLLHELDHRELTKVDPLIIN